MRAAITTWLEVGGLLLLVAAIAVLVWPVTRAGGLAVGGVGLLAASALISALAAKDERP